MGFIKIDDPKGIIPACDVPLEKVAMIAKACSDIKGVNALKVGGIRPTITHGLTAIVKTIRDYTDKPIIYDHQKGATDIPDLGAPFVAEVKEAEADEVILFPFGGAETARAWIQACQDEGLAVIVGGHMTQPKFLAIEGGFIVDPKLIYSIAAGMGIRHFIVPGNKVEFVNEYRHLVQRRAGEDKIRLSAPGFLARGGVISDTGRVAGDYWDAIVGRDITKHDTVKAMITAIESLVSQITATKNIRHN